MDAGGGLIQGVLRWWVMYRPKRCRVITITHIIYLGECIKLDYPITFCETY